MDPNKIRQSRIDQYRRVRFHGDHDQESHGNRGGGGGDDNGSSISDNLNVEDGAEKYVDRVLTDNDPLPVWGAVERAYKAAANSAASRRR